MLGKEYALKEIKKRVEARDLVNENQPRPKLIPSCAAGNTDHGYDEYVRWLLKLSMLM